jgi:hypothetical protein
MHFGPPWYDKAQHALDGMSPITVITETNKPKRKKKKEKRKKRKKIFPALECHDCPARLAFRQKKWFLSLLY